MALVAMFVVVFVAAIGVQIDLHRRNAERELLGRQAALAALVSERVDGAVGAAVAAFTSAGVFVTAGSGEPRMVVSAAARANGVAGAALFQPGGAPASSIGRVPAGILSAAARAAGSSSGYVGVVDLREQPPAAVLYRRFADGRALVSILDAPRLAPPSRDAFQVVLLDRQGRVVAPAGGSGSAARREELLARALAPNGASDLLITDGEGRRWAAASAGAMNGALRVVVASPAPAAHIALAQAAAFYALVAAAPLAAIGLLLLALRQSMRRELLAEEVADRAETNFRLAADGAHAGVFDWRIDTDVVQLSGAALTMLGATTDTMHAQQLAAFAVETDRAQFLADLRRAKQSGVLDARFRVSQGPKLVWLEARGTVFHEGDSNASGRLVGTLIDVTSRQQAQQHASRLERHLRAAIDSYDGPFALWDMRRRLLMWNETYARVFGLGNDILRPRASYAAVAAAAKPRIAREPVNPSMPELRTIELVTGEWFQLVERKTSDEGLVTVGVDITALKRKEEELASKEKKLSEALARAEQQEFKIKGLVDEANEAREAAEEARGVAVRANEAKSTFLANMSHELRTPLNAIIGFSELMEKELLGPIGTPQYRGYAKDIHGAGSHLLLLINDILDMAKIEAGKYSLAKTVITVSEEIDHAVRMNKPAAEKKGLPIVVDAPDLREIEADPRAVTQIVSNLLSNAIKFTSQGMVLIQAKAIEDGVLVRVADTGCGIPADHIDQLAQPFKQVESELSRAHQGSGLGLALVKTLAELHGGTFDLKSEVGKGTIVTITLPAGGAVSPGNAGDGAG